MKDGDSPVYLKTAAQSAVLNLIKRTCDSADSFKAREYGEAIGHMLTGCAAVLRAMDEITVNNE
jgi:hypothetical protein